MRGELDCVFLAVDAAALRSAALLVRDYPRFEEAVVLV